MILKLLKSQESRIGGTINPDVHVVDPASFALDNYQPLCSFILYMRLSFHITYTQCNYNYSLSHDNSIHLCIGSVFMKKVSQKRFNTLLCYISTEDDMPTITTRYRQHFATFLNFPNPNVSKIFFTSMCTAYNTLR